MMRRIGKYEIGATLGRGNYSKVKLAYDIEDNSEWALKIIDRAAVKQENMEHQLNREISVMKKLKHQNIVQLREVLKTSRYVYLVLELASKGDLYDQIVAVNRLDEKTARMYFQQLISGLHYCHKKGFAHRDLKPENLLLDKAGTLKMTDFGLCNSCKESTDDGQNLLRTACGTPNYVAPEVLQEKGYKGDVADIWSCGVILYVMLAGSFPFDGKELNVLLRKVERGEYQSLRMVSEEASDLIARMLTVDPQQRITLPEILKHPWFSVGLDDSTFEFEMYESNESTPCGRHPLSIAATPNIGSKVTELDVEHIIYEEVESNVIGKATEINKNFKDKGNIIPPDAVCGCTASSIDVVGSNTSNSTISTSSFEADHRRRKVENCVKRKDALPLHTNDITVSTRDTSVSLLHLAHTTFVFDGSIDDLIQSLDELGANPQQLHPMMVKGYTSGANGLLTYTATVSYSPTMGFLAVKMHQSFGDVIDFHEFYAQLLLSMKDMLRFGGEFNATGWHDAEQMKTDSVG